MIKKIKYVVKQTMGREDGQAFILILILVMVASLLITPLLSFMSTGIKTDVVYAKRTNTLYAADTGVQDAIWQLKNSHYVPTQSNNTTPPPISANGVIENTTISWFDNTPTYKIVAIAGKTTVTCYIAGSAGIPVFGNALCTIAGDINLSGGCAVSPSGSGGANLFAVGNVNLTGSATITGDAYSTVNETFANSSCKITGNASASGTVGTGGTITGSQTSGVTLRNPPSYAVDSTVQSVYDETYTSVISITNPTPTGVTTYASGLTISNNKANGSSIPSGPIYVNGDLSVGGGNTSVVLAGQVYVTGNISVSGGNQTVTFGGPVYAGGQLTSGGGTFNITFNGVLTTGSDINLGGNGSFAFNNALKDLGNFSSSASVSTSFGSISTIYVGGNLSYSGSSGGLNINSDVYVNGTLTTSGSAGAIIGPEKVVVRGKGAGANPAFSISGGSQLGTSQLPFIIVPPAATSPAITGSDPSSVQISGSGTASALIYAPTAAFSNSGGASLFGAEISKNTTMSGSAVVTYPSDLSTRTGLPSSGGIAVKSYVITNTGAGSPPVTISTSSLPSGTVNSSYSQTLTATNGTTPYTWSISVGSLPAGLSLNANTGAVTGTPTTAGTVSFTVQVTDNSSPTHTTATKPFSITINPALTISTTSLPNAIVNSTYSQTLTAANGTTPYTWSISVGSLPAGLSLNPSTGAIAGTPTTAGTVSFTVQVTDSASPTHTTATQALSITINPALAIGTASLTNGTVNSAYSQTLVATNGTTPYNWSISVGSLPAGLSLNPSTGAITGTPTTAGTANFTVQVTDSASPTPATATQALSITINPALAISTTSLPNGTVNSAYSQTLTATGGTSPDTWSISVGSLPTGLSLNVSTGAITGTPTTAGTTNFTVQVTDSASPSHATATKSLSITINVDTATKLAFATSAQTIVRSSQHGVSNAITIQSQDTIGIPVGVTGTNTINLTTTSTTGKFYSDYNGTTQITSVTIASGNNSATFYYKDDTVGAPTITAHQSSGTPTLSDGTQTETIRATRAITVSSSTNWSAITGGPPLMGDTVTISNSATVTVDQVGAAAYSITLAGSTSNGNNGTLAFNANTSLTITNLTVGTGHGNGSINMAAGGQFNILGTVTLTSAGTWTPGSGTVVYGASGAQTINATFFTSYYNLIFSGSGAKSMVTGTSVTGNLSIAPTGNATASVGAGLTLSVNTLTLGGTLQTGPGTWGGTGSGATHIVTTYFAATTGKLTVAH